MEIKFEKNTFSKRLKSMLNVDFRRMFTMPLFYIMLGIAFVIPILVLVMTTMMGEVPAPEGVPNTSTEMGSFTNVWQAIASTTDASNQMSMDLVSMCNINLLYFGIAVLVCLFVGDDFRSGYSKNLFTVRSSKKEYVISKTLVCFVCGIYMIIAYFLGAMIGGSIAQLSFDPGTAGVGGIIMCMITKMFLMLVFIPIYLVMSVVGKQKTWLSMILSFGTSMLLFTMIPMISPLDSTFVNIVLSLVGGVLFSVGIGTISNLILEKTSLV